MRVSDRPCLDNDVPFVDDFDLEAAGKLALIEDIGAVTVENGSIRLRTSLQRQGVSLLRLEA